eukprot:2191517-Karenia_brevis.AAC.1
MAYCDGRVTTEHISMIERRARIRQTIPDIWKWPKKEGELTSDYDYALGNEFIRMSDWIQNMTPETIVTIQQKVRIRCMLDLHWVEMQACAVHRQVAPLYREIADMRSRIKAFSWQFTNDE